MARTRSRQVQSGVVTLHDGYTGGQWTYAYTGLESCSDAVHRNYPHTGGDCYIHRTVPEIASPAIIPYPRAPGGVLNYYGQLAANASVTGWPIDTNPINLAPYVVEGFNKTKPGKPQVNLGEAIAELRDLPALLKGKLSLFFLREIKHRGFRQMLRGHRPHGLRGDLADLYLEWLFGWRQLVSDIQGLYRTQKGMDRTLRQLMRDAGRPVRRNIQLRTWELTDPNTGSWVNSYDAFVPLAVNPVVWIGTPRTRRIRTFNDGIRYSARFKYDMPRVGSSFWTDKSRLALFGLFPTPGLLWHVLPWSWLIDWFVGIGPVLDRISETAVDNLEVDYEFATFKRTLVESYESEGRMSSTASGGNFNLRAVTRVTRHVLQRSGSSNGFAAFFSGEGLTLNQLAILAALGLSKTNVPR